jgi:hypothetical protein
VTRHQQSSNVLHARLFQQGVFWCVGNMLESGRTGFPRPLKGILRVPMKLTSASCNPSELSLTVDRITENVAHLEPEFF